MKITLETIIDLSELKDMFKELANDSEYRANVCPNYMNFSKSYPDTWGQEYFLIKWGEKEVGYVYLSVYRHDRTADIKVVLLKKYRNKGFGFEASKLGTEYVFEVLGMEKIETIIFEYNKISLKGNYKYMIYEGCRRRNIYWKGKYWNKYLFGLTREEYFNRKKYREK